MRDYHKMIECVFPGYCPRYSASAGTWEMRVRERAKAMNWKRRKSSETRSISETEEGTDGGGYLN